MKIRKAIFISIILLIIASMTNLCYAYTISIDDISAKKGEEFTFSINVDKQTPLANGHIKFDNSKLEYLGSDQANLNQNIVGEGDIAWMYIDLEAQGTKSFEFKFKVKEDGESEISLEDLAFVDSDGNTYENEQISGNTSIKVKPGNTSIKNIIIIVIAVVIILAIVLCFINNKNKNKKSKKR